MIFVFSDVDGSETAREWEFTDLDEAVEALKKAIDGGANYATLEWDNDNEG
jgi:hypothetical protein